MSLLPRNWHAILNPNSLIGGNPGLWHRTKQLITQMGHIITEWESPSKEVCDIIVSKILNEKPANIIVVGGDGTLNQVVNSIMNYDEAKNEILLALIPAGTGNDWARTHHIPRRAGKLAEMFFNGEFFNHDIGRLSTSGEIGQSVLYFINIAGFGFDAEVIKRVQENPSAKNKWVYVKTLLAALADNMPVSCRLITDTGINEAFVFTLAAGICKFNGNGMKMVPMADPGDGKLDVVYIEPMTRWEIITQLPFLFMGKHISFKKVHHQQTRFLEIIPQGKLLAETEGEMAGVGNFKVTCLKNQLKILRPKTRKNNLYSLLV